jgi:hypothetical protein
MKHITPTQALITIGQNYITYFLLWWEPVARVVSSSDPWYAATNGAKVPALDNRTVCSMGRMKLAVRN